jgi:hypothetical protein
MFYGMVKKTVTATPSFSAPVPVVICTDRSDPSRTDALPTPAAKQLGVVAELGPVIVADIPVLVGAVNPQGLVNTVAVTVLPAANVLSLIFIINPTMVAFADIVTVLGVNCVEDTPRPTHPLGLTD